VAFDVAERMKIDYANGQLRPDDMERINALFADDCRVWLAGVELSLLEFAETDFMPSKIFLCGGGSGLPGIKQSLASGDWAKNLPFSKPPQIGFLQPHDITRIVDETGELNNPQDITPMGLAHLALLNALDEEPILTGILQRSMESIDKN
jgi:cell division protein FtsA